MNVKSIDRKARKVLVGASLCSALAMAACGTNNKPSDLEMASARITVARAPEDAKCIRVLVEGKATSSHNFTVTTGDSTVFVINGLQPGEAVFSAQAFAAKCALVGANSVATWSSDQPKVNLLRGAVTPVTITMRANAGANVAVNFPGDDPDGGVEEQHIPPDPFTLGAPGYPSFAVGDKGRAMLDNKRQLLLKRIEELTGAPVRIEVDLQTGVVLNMDLKFAGPFTAKTGFEKARDFLAEFLPLFDPRLSLSELLPAVDEGCGDATVVFSRQVSKLPVLGSRMTVQFSSEGNIVQLVNGVAPSPGRVLDQMPMPMGGKPIDKLIPADVLKNQAFQQTSVLVPSPDGNGLVRAQLVAWPKGNNSYGAAVTVGGVSMGEAGTLTVAGDARFGFLAGLPHFAPQFVGATAPPSFISYRNLEGVAVSVLPGERNPVESSYRFLNDHPALYRTGKPRCQFVSKGISEAAMQPGVRSVRMEQVYAGIPVVDSQLVLSMESTNHMMVATGHTLPNINLPFTASITRVDAEDRVRRTLISAPKNAPEEFVKEMLDATPVSRLVVFPGELFKGRRLKTLLAWEVKVSDGTFYVNATSGAVFYSKTGRHAANIVNDAQGANELGRLGYVTVDVNGVPTGAITPSADQPFTSSALSSVAGAYGSLGWSGLNGSGSNLVANINVNLATSPGGCPNAFFTGLINEAFFCPGLARNDVVGHEFTHGVIGSSSGLNYQDESGALNESFADLFGNLIFPDTAAGSWLVGESAGGALRDMQSPGSFGQPANFAGYRPRDATCDIFPWSCDSGFVHSNSGITNRAFVLLTDGIPMLTMGIGRPKMMTLGFLTMTRLPSNALMSDVPLVMRDVCDSMVSLGGLAVDGSAFTVNDCDQVPIAFNQVGLNPALTTGWSEPTLGFSGRDPFFTTGETTTTGCNVTNVRGGLGTLSGTLTSDLDPTSSVPTATDWGGLFGMRFVVPGGAPPFPIGTTSQAHSVDWFSVFGIKPSMNTQVIVGPPPLGAPDCITPVGMLPVERTSAISHHPFNVGVLFGASGTDVIGNNPTGMNPLCVLNNTHVEILNESGARIEGPANSVDHSTTVWIIFVPVDFHQRASLARQPFGGTDLSAPVNWSFDAGQQVHFRLRYYISQPTTVANCMP